MTEPGSPIAVAADYFDGRRARAHRVTLSVAGDRLRIVGDGIDLTVPLASVDWSERQRQGAWTAALPDGASLHALADEPWDALQVAAGRRVSATARAEQSWRGVVVALIALVLLLGGGWIWGVPLAARGLVAVIPLDVDRFIGDQVAASLGTQWFETSRLEPADRDRIAATFDAAVRSAWTGDETPRYQLRFVRSRIGPNAFALPGGQIMLTDELVALARKAGPDADAIVIGVLAHELGHVHHRHAMRALVQASLVAAVASVALGDFSALLAGAPAVLIQRGYSRDFERESDRESVRVLAAAGLPPAAMARFFELVAEARDDPATGGPLGQIAIALASHPADAERIRFFRERSR